MLFIGTMPIYLNWESGKNLLMNFQHISRINRLVVTIGKISKIGASFLFKESLLYKLEASSQVNVLRTSFNDFNVFNNIEDLPTDKLSNFLYNNMMSTSVQTLLHFEDRISMAS